MSFCNREEIVEFLVKHEADTEIPNNDGFTPLAQAAFLGHHFIAKLLIDHGSNVNAIGNQNGVKKSIQDLAKHPADGARPSQFIINYIEQKMSEGKPSKDEKQAQ